jgi:integrase
LKLQESGIEHLSDATEENILPLFIEPDGKIERHYSCTSKFAKVLKVCTPAFPDCANVLALLPAFKARRKNIQYLTPQEYEKVKETLLSNTSSLTLRNKAMGILALFTGLRGCDIAGLKLRRIERMGNVAASILKAANIRKKKGDRKGTHIFRHHLAARLLENGVPRPIISSIAGQTSPKSLDTYLSTDFVHLKECAIGIEKFPVAEAVFRR